MILSASTNRPYESFAIKGNQPDTHPRRPRGKIIGREEDKTAVSVGAKVYFSCVEPAR